MYRGAHWQWQGSGKSCVEQKSKKVGVKKVGGKKKWW